MPELPQVEALAGFLDERLRGRVVAGIQLVDFSALKTYAPPLDAIVGAEIAGVHRFGKFLDVDAQGTHLVFHLARGGWVTWKDEQSVRPARPGKGPLSLRVALDDGSGFDLTEGGTQKKLAVYVVGDPGEVPGIATLGPDPLDDAFDRAALDTVLERAGRAQIKGVLRDQRVIAGIGNAYSDEILHAARLSPFAPASGLDADRRGDLFVAVKTVLADALVRARGLPAKQLKDDKRAGMRVHGRTGEACPVCGTTIAEVSFADSSLQYCPGCQTGGKPLADRRMSKLLH
ncbi:Fpg/Nei family DNA glycosylase [Brooklawnia cerclae]|uniref:Formamidopyrimidine-DNA glycosylase n=1 Tax=Brooklawnia cerclae TaxID=349934 RepID=A0ABX0SML6_9ACTN|nr:DNA-formamidopyrimidine glycosylase family protein [Brooklawnia cerclae]NIH58568.1 formamidopyrimidine-DNA glycosylase [Brooklawnia cerclae]